MIGLDTNVLVRYIMQDDPEQSAKASLLIESLDRDRPGFISTVAVVELYWVLTASYALTGQQVAQALDAILRTKQFVVERADQVTRALRLFNQGGADFADCLIGSAATAAGCDSTMTFDVKASKHAGMTLIS
ncbi:PIN domain-containing protein [Rhodoferax sp.]|uniref:PIN domain-containing protein n=1 Tax=Rhodoferax sp. TaxID=50421 RepID=UPI0037839C78